MFDSLTHFNRLIFCFSIDAFNLIDSRAFIFTSPHSSFISTLACVLLHSFALRVHGRLSASVLACSFALSDFALSARSHRHPRLWTGRLPRLPTPTPCRSVTHLALAALLPVRSEASLFAGSAALLLGGVHARLVQRAFIHFDLFIRFISHCIIHFVSFACSFIHSFIHSFD